MFASWARLNEPTSVIQVSEILFHQFVADLPQNATETVKTLKTLKLWVLV